MSHGLGPITRASYDLAHKTFSSPKFSEGKIRRMIAAIQESDDCVKIAYDGIFSSVRPVFCTNAYECEFHRLPEINTYKSRPRMRDLVLYRRRNRPEKSPDCLNPQAVFHPILGDHFSFVSQWIFYYSIYVES